MDKLEYGVHPAPANMPEIKGIFVGGCVQRGVGSSFRRTAHAHFRKDDPHYGWLCFRSPKRVYSASGKPTQTLWHEYAHILAGSSAGHGPRFQKVLRDLGQTREAERTAAYCKRRTQEPE